MAYTLTPTNDLVNHTKSFEGFMKDQYHDVNGMAIGYGNHYYYPNGPSGAAVKIPSDYGSITEQEAHQLCVDSLTNFMINLNKHIKVDLNQNQFEALVCVAYAMGIGGLLGTSLYTAVSNNPNDLGPIETGFRNAHQHKERLMMEFEYYKTGKLACKAGYVPPSSSSGTSTASTASDAVSKDSARQIRYFNTNYCNSIICDGDLVNTGGTSGSNSGGGGGGSTGQTPVSKPENKIAGTVDGNQAANALIDAYKKGYRLWNWKCHGFYLYGKVNIVKFSATICKGNNNVGALTVSIGDDKTYRPLVKPNSLENDTTQMLREKGARAQLSALEEFHLIIIDAKKEKIKYGDLEKIFNEKPTNRSDTKQLSMFDVLYTHFNDSNKYTKINRKNEYDKICAKGEQKINDKGVVEALGKGRLVYFTDIKEDCDCYGKDAYFGVNKGVIAITYNNSKVVRFSAGKNRGSGAGWDDIHMITK